MLQSLPSSRPADVERRAKVARDGEANNEVLLSQLAQKIGRAQAEAALAGALANEGNLDATFQYLPVHERRARILAHLMRKNGLV